VITQPPEFIDFRIVTANALVISQLTKNAVYVTLTNVIINIIGNIILIPKIGILGAAVMTVVSELIQGVYYFYVVHTKITHFSISGFFLKPLAASIVMGLAILPLVHLPVLITIAIGAIVYGSVLILLRFFNQQDIVFIKNTILKRTA
jgi:O-antigen/teichoic acid export membrane protein